jgi:hypothetical protein
LNKTDYLKKVLIVTRHFFNVISLNLGDQDESGNKTGAAAERTIHDVK